MSPVAPKRPFPNDAPDDNDTSHHPPKRVHAMTFAAKLNAKTLRQLQEAYKANPEVDLTVALPKNYSSRLASRLVDQDSPCESSDEEEPNESTPLPLPTSPASIIHPLSSTAQDLLGLRTANIGSTPSVDLTKALADLIQNSDLIWQSSSTTTRYVTKCTPQLVLKSIPCSSSSDFTEYTTLQYLQHHLPHLPIPRPHGLLVSGESAYLLMPYIPGTTLVDAWPHLPEPEKTSLSAQLDAIFSSLRQLRRPADMPLGGVAGEGCKDTRRNTWISRAQLYTSAELWDFQYANAPVGSATYLEFLRRLTAPFVARDAGRIGGYEVTGVIDWEMSGFYPEDFECTKVTNTMAANEEDDWFLHLPSCVSPARFPERWLSDFAWEKQVV
ncbi:hypothetical protein VE03_02438 [Pseudogymnoascus sp. 23342-1-I1]|nr:hypothetical protein VE03_02438 [Pseudogymnoascus sp. 23342-1-I1]